MSKDKSSETEEKSIKITDNMVRDLMKEVLELERDNLYVNRPNLKEKITTLIKTKVR